MKSIGAYEAKTNLSKLLDSVEDGQDVTITRYGQPVARLVPVGNTESKQIDETIEDIKAFRRGQTLGDHDLRDLIEKGRT